VMELAMLSQSSNTTGAGKYSKSITVPAGSGIADWGGGGGSSRLSRGEWAGANGECEECEVEPGDECCV
jgi:hypothetical protein